MVDEQLPSRSVPVDDERIKAKLAQLFGESLFGPWPELWQKDGQPERRRRSLGWFWKLGGAVAIVVGLWGAKAFFEPGLVRQDEDRRANFADELRHFLKDGDLEHSSEFVDLVRETSPNAAAATVGPVHDSKDPHLDLVIRTEAALYRFYDAAPERMTGLRVWLSDLGHPSVARKIARLTVGSRGERATSLAEIEQLRQGMPNDYELEYLYATALDARGDVDAARDAYARSARLGPAWLGHRFEQVWFELRHERRPDAQKLAREMERVDPDSPWARLVLATCELARNPDVSPVREQDAAVPKVTPVQTYFEALQQSIAAARRGNETESLTRLTAAANAIHHQPAFLFDALDWLIEEKQLPLARALTGLPEWPSGDPQAQAKAARLSAATAASAAVDTSTLTQAAAKTKSAGKSRAGTKRKSSHRGKK